MFKFNQTAGKQRTIPANTNGMAMQKAPAYGTLKNNIPADQPKNPQTAATDPEIERMIDEIEAQRIEFSKKYPDFDMRAEMENPQFANYVWGNGLSIEDAFFLTHKEEIIEEQVNAAVTEILSRRDRISENGAAKNRPAIAKKNPKDLSDKEVDAIIERAKNGEKITF